MWLGVRDVFSPRKYKCGADVCLLQPRGLFQWVQPNGCSVWGQRVAPRQPVSQQTVAPASSTRLFCCFHFGRDRCQRSPFGRWLRWKSKRHDYLGAGNVIPHLRREFCNELANLAVSVTQVTQFGRCREHLFWEQEVHLMKMAGLFCISYTLIIPILIFKKALSEAFRFTFLTENYGLCNI